MRKDTAPIPRGRAATGLLRRSYIRPHRLRRATVMVRSQRALLTIQEPTMTQRFDSPAWLAPIVLGSAAALAASAFYTAVKTRDAEHETPPIGEFITVDGVRLH